MDKEISQFLELVNPLPAYKILEVTSHADDLSVAVAMKLKPLDGELDIALYPGEHQTMELDNIRVSAQIDSYSKPFKAPARSYDIIILRDILDRHAFSERILKLAYGALANAGGIIVIQRKGSIDAQEMARQLEDNEFRASNRIDIFNDADLIMAKKLHMWGNGL